MTRDPLRAARVRIPWHAHLILLRPRRVLANLEAVHASPQALPKPSLWQLELAVLRMWQRILFRSETIGTSIANPVRPGWRARWLERRGIRFFFLLYEGSVRPWDLSGLLSTPQSLIRHLLGTHHDGAQFVYDLEILSLHEGQLAALRERARSVIEQDTPRSRWLRDLCVYEGYHEALLKAVLRAQAGDFGDATSAANDPDIRFRALLAWAARQPATPRETWRAWRRGEFRLAPGSAPQRSRA
jgi:hypothetical protein